MLDLDVGTDLTDALEETGGTHCGGAHAGVAGEDDLLDGPGGDGGGVDRDVRGGRGVAGAGVSGVENGVRPTDDWCGDEERDDCGGSDVEQHEQDLGLGSHGDVRDDGARGRGAGEAEAEHDVEKDGHEVAGDGADDDLGVHEYIREVDLMDAAEELDDDRSGGGLLGGLVLAEQPVRHEHADARSGVGLEHVHHGLTGGLDLLGTDGHEDAVADGVVEEEDLGGLDEDGQQRHQAVVDEHLYARGEHGENGAHEGPDAVVAEDAQREAYETEGEVVDEHLEAGGLPVLSPVVPLFDDPACERTHEHGAHEHGVVGAHDGTEDRDRADDATALAGDGIAALSGDEHRDQVLEHRADDCGELFVGEPTRLEEDCREEAPGDERTNVRHDHS